MRLTRTPTFVRAVFCGAPLARWADRHPCSGLCHGDSLLFVWQPPGATVQVVLKRYGVPESPSRVEPWALAQIQADAEAELGIVPTTVTSN